MSARTWRQLSREAWGYTGWDRHSEDGHDWEAEANDPPWPWCEEGDCPNPAEYDHIGTGYCAQHMRDVVSDFRAEFEPIAPGTRRPPT